MSRFLVNNFALSARTLNGIRLNIIAVMNFIRSDAKDSIPRPLRYGCSTLYCFKLGFSCVSFCYCLCDNHNWHDINLGVLPRAVHIHLSYVASQMHKSILFFPLKAVKICLRSHRSSRRIPRLRFRDNIRRHQILDFPDRSPLPRISLNLHDSFPPQPHKIYLSRPNNNITQETHNTRVHSSR